MLTTRLSRMYRNKRKTCFHDAVGPNGLCPDCGKVNVRKRIRFNRLLQADQTVADFVAELAKPKDGVFEKKN